MRVKDEQKNEAIFGATTELLNEIGLSDISMSKIAKRAGISSSTIYVYFKNKDDMLIKTYLHVKRKLLEGVSCTYDRALPFWENIENTMRKCLRFILDNPSYFLFIEQFSNAPIIRKLSVYSELDAEDPFLVYGTLFKEAVARGEVKDMDLDLLVQFCYGPIAYLAKDTILNGKEFREERLRQVMDLCWSVIKA